MYDETFVIAAGARGVILVTIVRRSSFTGGTTSVLIVEVAITFAVVASKRLVRSRRRT